MKSFLRFASLLLLQFCFIHPMLLAQTPDSWTQKANFGGLGRLNAVGFNIGNKGYIGTGANATTAFSDIWEYDPSTDTWAQKADYGGGARRGAYAFVVGNKAYVGGGSNSAADENPATSSLWEYNSFANTWTQKASSGPLFYGSVAFSIDGKGYVITGGIASYSADNMNFALTRRSSGNVAMYDPETDTWTNKARGPFDLAGAFGFTINGKGYVGGGTDNAGGIKKGFYEYNPATDSWTAKADFAGDRAFGSPSFVLGNKGFVGLTGLVGAAQNLYEYNPASDTWTSRAVYPDGATVGGAAFSIGNKGYIGTGSSKNTFYEYTSAETFTPATALKFDPSETAGDNSRLNYVSVDNPFRGFQKEITVEFWMYAPSANMPFGSIMGQGSNNVDANWVWLMHPETNGTMTFYVSDGASFKTAKCNIIAGSWHHYAATSSAGSTKFYVDGNEVSFYTINGQQFNDAVGGGLSSGLLSNNNAVLHIGKDVRYATRNIGNNDPKNRYAVMTIDEVRIWNRALCADEIRHNKNVEINPAVQTGLQHYYSFNQGLVNANNPGETILRDLSGNNRNGELKNFSLYGTNSNWVASGFTSTGIYTLYDNSAAPITGSNNVCIGNSTTLSNAKSGGKWLSSNPGVATINEVTGQVNAISAGVTTITYTTSCGAVSSMNLSVNPIPTTSITGTNTICSGSTTTLTASGGTGTTYLWNTGATTASINVSPTVTTTYTVTATNAGGCTAQASSTVTVNAVPTVSISGINTICSGSTTTLTASGAIGTTYLWSTGATTASINVSPTATTTYTVTATNAVGCTNQASSTVTVNAAPTAAISGTNTICSGGSTTLIATGGGGGTTYAWNTGATTFAIPVSPTVTTTYSVTLTNTAGCTSQASRTVTVNPTPSVTASSNSPVVLGNTLQLSANGTTNYSWSGPNGFTSSLQNPVINNVTAAANGTYTVTGTDAGPGCTNTASVNVNVLSTPATALKTDGVDDHVTISNPFRAFNKEITVEFWMNTPTGELAQGSIMGQSSLNVDGMGTDVWLMHPDLGGTNLDFYVNDAGTWRRATVPIIAGGWHHYVGVASEFGIKFYVDGVLKKTETGVSTGILNNPNSIMQIGKDPRHTNFRFADMTIDEVRIWSRALCLEEINNNKNCELNPTGQNGLQQYYRFNQGIVGANNSTETSLTDLSGNNRHGVLSGFALTGANSNWVASGSTNTGTCTSFSTPTAPITGTTTICGIGNTSTLSNAIAGGLWSSSNTNIATIHANTGLVTALSEGTTTITYKNECGGISTVTVRVVSTIPPTITGPAGGTNVCPGNTVTLTAPVALANYQWFRDGVAVTSTTSTRTYNATVSGTYTATRISSGCTSALSNAITVTIADAVKPSITCPPNQTIDLDANCKATLPDYRSLLTVSDNCTPIGSLVITQSPAAGSEVNNKGSMIVTFTVRDASGNESTCTITIEKKDVTGPIVTCPAPIVVNATTNTCGAVVTFTSPNATDNCGIIPFTSFRGGEPNQFQGALQDYLQLYTDGTWDDLQNTTLNKWIVEFNTIITTSFPGYIRIGEFGGHTYYVSTSTATWINARVSAQSIGGDLVSINTQAENSFVAPSGIAWVGGYQDLSDSKYIEPGNASQNYGGWKWVDGTSMSTPKITITQTAGLPSGSVFPVGVTTNTFIARDESGNESTCSFTVTVRDVQPPVISCPANINVTATSAAGAVVNYTTPVGTDNCGGATTERTAGLASGSTFPIGTTTVTYRVTDAAGLFTECSFTVTVVGVAPVISCPANITVNAAAGTCAANVNFAATETVGFRASTITYTINGNPVVSGASFPVGTTTVVATATNAVGSSSCSFTVTVVDNQNPTITAPADVQGNNTAGLCTGTVTLGAPVTSDNCGVASVTNDAPITGIFPVGTTTVIWTVTDIHGNKSTATQTVVIVDNEKPTISVTNVNVNNDAGKCGASITIAQPITADNCDIASVVGVRSDNASLSAEYPVGTTTITWKVTDIHGNDATTTQTVVVSDTELPVVKTNNIVVQLGANGQASITTSQINNGSTDNCAIASIVLDKMNFNCSNVGENTVLLTVTDIHGNSASANATVTVQDNILPTVITQPVTVTLVNGAASVTATQVNNGSFDNCGIATMTVSPANFNCNNIGSNTVILTVTDVNGNTNTRSAIVTVVGQLPSCSITSAPTSNVFTGGNPNNIYLGYGAQSTVLNVAATGGSSYTYQWSGTATQMLSSTTAAAPVFTPTAPGNYTFTVTVTNNFGCTSTCSITICVKDIRVPGTGLKGSPAKVYICHVPPGNPNNPQTLEISVNAVATHIGKHDGDRLGTCAMTPCAEPAPTTVSNALTSKAVVEGESKAATDEELKVTVMPNPSATYFTLKLESKYDAPVNMRVVDVLGRVVDNRMKLGSNATVEVGHNYQSGTYFAEFIQGNRRKVVQLLKIKR
jgi:hypothetical protein